MLKWLVLTAAGITAIIPALVGSAEDSLSLPYRLQVPQVAREDVIRLVPPPPGDGYCPGDSSSPPNSVIGLLNIAGQPAPAGTLVTLTFNGLPGPSALTQAAGGYRVDFVPQPNPRDPPCINDGASTLGVLVNGVHKPLGITAKEAAAGLVHRSDIDLP